MPYFRFEIAVRSAADRAYYMRNSWFDARVMRVRSVMDHFIWRDTERDDLLQYA